MWTVAAASRLKRMYRPRTRWLSLLGLSAVLCWEAAADLVVREAAESAPLGQLRRLPLPKMPERPVLRLSLTTDQVAGSQGLVASSSGLTVKAYKIQAVSQAVGEAEAASFTLTVQASTFYDGQVRELQLQPAPVDPRAGRQNFLLTHDVFLTDVPQAFDGSGYTLLMLTFQPCPAKPPQQLPLCDLDTGELLMTAVASVTPQERPLDPVTQSPASRILLAGGLLLGLLGCRRKPVPGLDADSSLASALQWLELCAEKSATVVVAKAPALTLKDCLYNRLLRPLTAPDAPTDVQVADIPLYWRCFQGLDEALALTPNPWKWRPRAASSILPAHETAGPSRARAPLDT